MGASVVFLAPVLLSNIAMPSWNLVQQFLDTISPQAAESVEIFPAFPRCEFTSGKIHVSSDLRLEGADMLLLKAHDLAIYKIADAEGDGAVYIGRPNEDQSGIILSRGKYVHVELLADFSPVKTTVQRPVGRFFCKLRLFQVHYTSFPSLREIPFPPPDD
jgi:hypothetical protein